MAAQSLSSPSKSCWNHDVFLSFRGEDTRKNFTDHLYTALLRAGIHTFRDDEELPRGEHISTELLKAIQGSRISIVVFSKDYASSRWCLDELVEIMHCKNTLGQTLLPIFYDVNPSDVRKQTGTLAKAFSSHEERFQAEMERVQKWRAALTEAANYSGWDLQNIANGYESKFIEKIVEEILCIVSQAYLHVAMHPIGIHSRVEKMKALLNLGTSDVCIVGMYGMGGIGKTTIAKALYNEICHEFEGSSFLFNIKEISEQQNGLIHLQEKLLSDILKTKNWKIGNVDGGINLITKRFCHKKVLVVLDDVDHLKQLNSLVGNFELFGQGSRVIVTTRDEHLLIELGVNKKYKVEELNLEESLQLFSWHAFRMAHPVEDFLQLSFGVVGSVGGLPLAVEVLGSYLSGRSIIEWESALEKLQKIPHKQIQKILRISFDSLEDDALKDIFLDIACFFIGINKEYASKVLDGCGFFPDIGVSILIQRSLLMVNEINELRMHDLIRDMGREIVREMSPKDPGKRSRLWFYEDVLDVLNKHLGSEVIEGLILNLPALEDVRLKTEAFAKMKNLRLLQIDGAYLTGCYDHLSKELRWLHWHKCPLKFLDTNFHLENLVILDMECSNVRQVWKDIKILNKLKVLNLRGSKCLTQSPNFSRVPHLEILILEDCTSLVEVHESIGHLKKLVLLNLQGCKKLKNLPESISKLESLKTLNLSDCIRIDKLPTQLGNMVALTELHADRTAIEQLPYSFGLLKKLRTVSLSGCKGQSSKSWMPSLLSWLSPKCSRPINLLPTSISGLCSLTKLDLNDCNLFEDGIPIDLGSLSSLDDLNLGRNNFLNLPHCISRLPKLTTLRLSGCTSLQSISELPPSLISLHATDCTSIETLSIPSNLKRPPTCFLTNCQKLVEIQGLESLEFGPLIHMEQCNNLAYDCKRSLLQCLCKCDELRAIFLPSSEVPNWFSHQGIGCSICFDVPPLSEGEIRGLLVCAVYAAKEESSLVTSAPFMKISNKTRGHEDIFRPTFHATPITCEDHSCVCHIPLKIYQFEMESGEEMEVHIISPEAIEVKKCGIHLLFDDSNLRDDGYVSMDMMSAKRGRDDNEAAGPSNDEEKCPKRARIESEAQE